MIVLMLIVVMGIFKSTYQYCPEEISHEGIVWRQTSSPNENKVTSVPLCYQKNTLITRNCLNSTWMPPLDEIGLCLDFPHFQKQSCPTGSTIIPKDVNDYCYQIGEASTWNLPCYESGAASIITDLSTIEIEYLLNSLTSINVSRYFWLPAQRRKLFHPVVWTIPGPHWGRQLSKSSALHMDFSITKNCLLLDIKLGKLLMEACSAIYPSLCINVNNLHFSTKCPFGYHYFHINTKDDSCYGIETSEPFEGLTFDDFLKSKCINPIVNDIHGLNQNIFKSLAVLKEIPDNVWCWIQLQHNLTYNGLFSFMGQYSLPFQTKINKAGSLQVIRSNDTLPCMACESKIIYGDTKIMFEYNQIDNKIYVTVYYPSGLLKYNDNDKGFQCFSNAEGFDTVVDINDVPLMETKSFDNNIEKIIYNINLVTESSAQYWCEGHKVNFSLITTEKIIVNPKGNHLHVFSLVVEYYIPSGDFHDIDILSDITITLKDLFDAETVLLMDIFEYILGYMMILLHLHVPIDDIYHDEALNIKNTYDNLKLTAEINLPKYNLTFVNISSSVYCLSTTSKDSIILDWEMTAIGHISAPKQFCLQANGLPVKRHCHGSYLLGSIWGEVAGHCDNTYEPSETTSFLYNFVKEDVSASNISKFLTEGLVFVLDDTETIIPADIYYLSISLQKIQTLALHNVTSIDMGDIENIAWIMDRVMVLNCTYLSLAQTMNSTNVILDSVTDIIEIIAENSINATSENKFNSYEIAIQPQIIVQISYPKFNNITGIAIFKNEHSDHFTDMVIKPLYSNTSLENVLSMENLEIATWLPTNILETLRFSNSSNDYDPISEHFHVTITIFHNNAMFQELNKTEHTINSRIIGINIPNYFSNLEYPVLLLFKQMNHSIDGFCGYWDFQSQSDVPLMASWKNSGCVMANIINNITICECYHLTHFGQLLYIPDTRNQTDTTLTNETHTIALNIITLVGSFLSLLGIIGIWITALVFRNWRKKAGTKILLQLSTAIALPLIFIVVFNLDTSIIVLSEKQYVVAEHMTYTCIVVGALLHFSILASFMWMLITAVLQFIRYVRVLGVLRPARFMFKFTIIGWGLPLIPVITTLAIDAHNYIPEPSFFRRICYPTGSYLFLGVILPIFLILLTNVILFILILYAISTGSDQKIKSTDMDLVWAQLRVSIFLFFLLGLTWLFGIFSFSQNLVWSYLFCLTSTVQGFVLFLYFIICDPSTRNLWLNFMRPQFTLSSSRNSISSINTN